MIKEGLIKEIRFEKETLLRMCAEENGNFINVRRYIPKVIIDMRNVNFPITTEIYRDKDIICYMGEKNRLIRITFKLTKTTLNYNDAWTTWENKSMRIYKYTNKKIVPVEFYSIDQSSVATGFMYVDDIYDMLPEDNVIVYWTTKDDKILYYITDTEGSKHGTIYTKEEVK